MFHYFSTLTDDKGNALPGYQVEVVQLEDGQTVVPIFSDENETPIQTVSGVPNRALTDAAGNYDFFVENGTYSLRFYDDQGGFLRTQRYLPFYGAQIVDGFAGPTIRNTTIISAGETSFTLDYDLPVTLVTLDGLAQAEMAYSVDGFIITFVEAVPADTVMDVYFATSGEPAPNQREFDTVQVLLANTDVSYPAVLAGEIITTRKEGFSYVVADENATDADVVTAGSLKLYVQPSDGEFNVKAFGAVGDGVTDDTAAIQAAIDAATAGGKSVFIPEGVYSVSRLAVSNGVQEIKSEGVIKGQGITGPAPDAVIVLGEDGAGVQGAKFTLNMDQSEGDLVAVQGFDTKDCAFSECRIYGFIDDPDDNHFAFRLNGGCEGNVFSNNDITLFDSPTQRGFGVALYGEEGAQPYAGFFQGTFDPSTKPCKSNIISNNVVRNGGYAVSLLYAEECIVSDNYFTNQYNRSIYLAAGAQGNVISDNQLIGYRSSAVLIGYNSWYNVVSGNHCFTATISGEAAININTGSSYNLIADNYIDSASNYGVFMGADMRSNVIQGNYVRGQYLAAIALDSDFISPRPAGAIFSRPNYGAPPPPYDAWSYSDSTDNVIKNNTIDEGYPGRNTGAISVAQIDGTNQTSVLRTEISGNSVISAANITQNLWLYADQNSKLLDTVIMNNAFNSGNSQGSQGPSGPTTWASRISYYADNKELDELINAEPITLEAGNPTPSVATNSSVPSERIYQFGNITPTDVTNFTGAYTNQQILLRLDVNTTIKYNSGLIRTKGNADVTGNSNLFIKFAQMPNGIWYETFRSF